MYHVYFMFTYVTFLYYKSTHMYAYVYTQHTHTHTRSIFKGPSLSSYERPKAAHGGVHGPLPGGPPLPPFQSTEQSPLAGLEDGRELLGLSGV